MRVNMPITISIIRGLKDSGGKLQEQKGSIIPLKTIR